MPVDFPRMTSAAIILQGTIADLGDNGAPGLALFASPEAGWIKEVHVVRDAAGGAGTTDLTITTPGGAVTPVMTMLTAGAAGDVDSFEFGREDTNNVLAAQDGFSIQSDGDFGGTPKGDLVVVVEAY